MVFFFEADIAGLGGGVKCFAPVVDDGGLTGKIANFGGSLLQK